jgi:hypothetical protein
MIADSPNRKKRGFIEKVVTRQAGIVQTRERGGGSSQLRARR